MKDKLLVDSAKLPHLNITEKEEIILQNSCHTPWNAGFGEELDV